MRAGRFTLFSVLLATTLPLQAQPPAIDWSRCIGGSGGDSPQVVRATTDGGYILAGSTSSTDGDVAAIQGASDCWVVKLAADGTIIWERTVGGSSADQALDVVESADGGYLVAGTTLSPDVPGYHGGGVSDYLVFKLSADGGLLWQRALGGSNEELVILAINDHLFRNWLVPAADGGCFFAGAPFSIDGDVTGAHGTSTTDIWVVRLGPDGALQWQRTLGGSEMEVPYGILATADGGATVMGATFSADGDVTGQHGEGDVWVAHLTDGGDIAWARTFGGSAEEVPYNMTRTADGGYAIGAVTSSTDGDVTGAPGGGDWWLLKLRADGTLQWQRSLGGPGYEHNVDVLPAADGGYFMLGTTTSSDGGDLAGSHVDPSDLPPLPEYWAVRTDTEGEPLWQRCLGGTGSETVVSAALTPDGGCVLYGAADSDDGDVTGHQGELDGWVAKLSATGALDRERTLATTHYEWPNTALALADGGLLICNMVDVDDGDAVGSGYHGSSDIWLVKLGREATTTVSEETPTAPWLAPDPATTDVRILLEEALPNARGILLDATGRVVWEKVFSDGQRTVDVSALPRGLYLFTLRTSAAVRTQRLVLE